MADISLICMIFVELGSVLESSFSLTEMKESFILV